MAVFKTILGSAKFAVNCVDGNAAQLAELFDRIEPDGVEPDGLSGWKTLEPMTVEIAEKVITRPREVEMFVPGHNTITVPDAWLIP